ncbi:ABC transporter ATP-binding protein [Microbacterium sp. X-17]|uniref:ABC transporter ATP-binding protein n=1 Tax=Microbacterium sp. X-17 TaxID=3144404 RepID=UPI0031F5CE5A
MTRIDVDGVGLAFGSTQILDDVSLTVPAGGRLAIVGDSGSGKTSLLRVIAGFSAPSAGTVRLDGVEVAGPDGVLPAHRRRLAYVPQDGALFPHLTVRRNIGFGVRGMPMPDLDALCDTVGLPAELLDRYPDELSGGQQQRVALARALAVGFPAILLDEPFSALDAGLRERARRRVVAELAARGATAILVTHDQEEALTFGDRLAIVQGGRLRQAGAPEDLYDLPRTAEIARFLGPACFLAARVGRDAAETALGAVALRGPVPEGSTRVMLRPAQFRIVADAPDANAVVAVATRRGPGVELELDTGAETLALVADPYEPVPAPGDRVRVEVRGTGVAFAAE